MQAPLDARLGGLFADFVVFFGRPLHVIHGRVSRPIEAGYQHLLQPDVVCPSNSARLILPEFIDVEVRAFTLDAEIAEDFPELGAFVFSEPAEAGIGISYWRAQLDGLKSCVSKLLDRSGEVLGGHLADRIRLTSNRDAKRIGAKSSNAR